MTDCNIIQDIGNMPSDIKKAYLTYLYTNESEQSEQVKARLKTLLKPDEDDAVRAMAIQIMGASVDEQEIRESLTEILPELSKESASYCFIKSLMITALSDDMDEVRAWGKRMIREYEQINTDNNNEISDFLYRTLDNENAPVHLRWHCALGLAYIGTKQAVDKLMFFCKKLLFKMPIGPNSESADSENIDKILAEKAAYSIGTAAEKICAYGKSADALGVLQRISERIGENGSVTWASDRFKHIRSAISEQHTTDRHFFQSFSQFLIHIFTFRFAGAIAAACLVIIVILYKPETADIRIVGIRGNALPDTRGKTSASEFEIKEGGSLKSGDSFNIRFVNHKDAYLYVLLYDSAGEITELFSDKVSSGKAIVIANSKDGSKLILDDTVGDEILYFLTSEAPIEDFDKKLDILRKTDMDQIQQIFPKTSIRTFRFGHET